MTDSPMAALAISREEAQSALGLKTGALAAAITRLIKRQRLANPRHGFYLIPRPEDPVVGAPDPVRWIAPLMTYQRFAYRISLTRAAAFHGSSHQAAMVFQVVVPKQLRDVEIGRHRLQFLYHAPEAFAQVAGVELTLLDCPRYLHKAAGINGVAQIAQDIGAKADPRKLAKLAVAYEDSRCAGPATCSTAPGMPSRPARWKAIELLQTPKGLTGK